MKELNRFRQFLTEGKMDKFKVGQTVKYKAAGKEREGEIEKIDGIYLKLKSGGTIPYQSVLEEETVNENKADVFDYADRIMGAGVDDPIGLIDFYDDNIEDLPEPMDPKIFKANIDAIKARVSEYQKMMGEGTVNEGMYQEVDNMLSKTAVHMKADDFVDELIEELEAMKGAIPFLHKALKTIMANNNIPE